MVQTLRISIKYFFLNLALSFANIVFDTMCQNKGVKDCKKEIQITFLSKQKLIIRKKCFVGFLCLKAKEYCTEFSI